MTEEVSWLRHAGILAESLEGGFAIGTAAAATLSEAEFQIVPTRRLFAVAAEARATAHEFVQTWRQTEVVR